MTVLTIFILLRGWKFIPEPVVCRWCSVETWCPPARCGPCPAQLPTSICTSADAVSRLLSTVDQSTTFLTSYRISGFSRLIDWVLTLRPTRHKMGHFGYVSQGDLLTLCRKKLNLTQQKHAFTDQKKCATTQNKYKKTKARFSRLVAFYDILPGNGAGLFSKEKISRPNGGDK